MLQTPCAELQNLEGHGDLVNGLIIRKTRVVIFVLSLLAKSPLPSK